MGRRRRLYATYWGVPAGLGKDRSKRTTGGPLAARPSVGSNALVVEDGFEPMFDVNQVSR